MAEYLDKEGLAHFWSLILNKLNNKIESNSVTSTINNTTNIPTSNAVKTYVDTKTTGASYYLGTVSALTNLSTTANKGDFYRVSGEWNGVHVGDIIIAEKNNPS